MTEEQLNEYQRLVYATESTDAVRSPKESKEAEEELRNFVSIHLPRLSEAVSVHAKKSRELYEASVAPKPGNPIEIALDDERVIRWLQERKPLLGSYEASSRLIRSPSLFEVEFRFKDGSALQAQVDGLTRQTRVFLKRHQQ